MIIVRLVFYCDQPFQPQPILVDLVEAPRYKNTFPSVFGSNPVMPGYSHASLSQENVAKQDGRNL